jgi:hypothetical protein
MRLVAYRKGRFHLMSLGPSANTAITAPEVEQFLAKHVSADGSISKLSVDFCGSYIPLVCERDVRLVSCLLAAYHNSMLCSNIPEQHANVSRPAMPHRMRRRLEKYSASVTEMIPAHIPCADLCSYYDEDSSEYHECEDGLSEDEETREYQRKLQWDYEVNADIDATPSFGKVGQVLW